MATMYIIKSLLSKTTNHLKVTTRFGSTCQKLIYDSYGDPTSVVRLETCELRDPKPNEVVVKMLAAPINPADINTIQGVYPVKPPLPTTPGNEGVGEVLQTGSGVKELKIGDWVVPRKVALGTWQTHAICAEGDLQRISNQLELAAAATISVNPCTAYRMLRDFAKLKEGDVVIQNGANSACGQAVIQLCREWGFRTVNVVRNRENLEELKENLKQLGADFVITEEELPALKIFKDQLPRPKLGLNCVGGKNCLNLLRHLEKGAYLVTYGGMSREPVTVPTSALIFKNLHICGFWMTEWNKKNAGSSDHVVMLSEIASLSKSKKLQPPAYRLVSLVDYKKVLEDSVNIAGKVNVKSIFDFTK